MWGRWTGVSSMRAVAGRSRHRGRRRWRRPFGFARHPGVEKAALGVLDIVADHDSDLAPAAARQRPAAQIRGLDANQKRDQHSDQGLSARPNSGEAQADRERNAQRRVAQEGEPQPPIEQP